MSKAFTHGKTKHRKMAEKIANELFKLGNEPNSPCNRIEFKGGHYGFTERGQGGLCITALYCCLEKILSDISARKT